MVTTPYKGTVTRSVVASGAEAPAEGHKGEGTSALQGRGLEFFQEQERASAVGSALGLQTGADLPMP